MSVKEFFKGNVFKCIIALLCVLLVKSLAALQVSPIQPATPVPRNKSKTVIFVAGGGSGGGKQVQRRGQGLPEMVETV